ncbi:limonene-1,2-epoxide hydrolase [Mycobacteroides abscessus subsp. massiliense]|uniref:nuclear transport factor 2 family protein n=1 Tax=Mycobacteroides abscessus TaxID=36809 RepID=UPI0009A7D30B|nr:nuclear transport factor 2 family protein [Mycobacteroides abscessus]MBN7321796.1 nuclear transport factor 2 family protein [Mycobacteroides abscessus subsp. massiliense]SKD41022.1 limonene-1,2-epoxide hydrolase [Mycobacteroides abscessus subsp. massiliense]SKD91604.1 limonene-1,2-epoxide hydrolase [Mycobacteroides abscessus subsp. massiliense]SKE02018.1 limonene-1,2-epoxide hydrolase [Mycobacteroides abscessus subsp. massiliense]SKE06178.1 limonene-1,2-epoxide hydrolase [Mycobacteroides ab
MAAQASLALGLWLALAQRNWEAVKTFLDDGCISLDIPVGPAAAARGPENTVKRLKTGLEPLKDYAHHDGLIVSNGQDVMYEYSETWTWDTGETALLRFASVLRVDDGKITLWKDYWDMAAPTNSAPPSWMENLLSADMSWIYDATGQV